MRLIREVTAPGRCGPANGMYALQRALRAQAPAWLKIGGVWRPGEIPWFWCWRDRPMAAACAQCGQEFIVGPNVLFDNSADPCGAAGEREVCAAASCVLMFTESRWYQDLIEQYRGPDNKAPVVLWPYPIDPRPAGPSHARYDVLIYAKSGYRQGLVNRITRTFPRHRLMRYGSYRRQELFDAAERSRCCVYLSSDDRGPLALAEILLAGCPAVGIPTGAPFIEPGRTGILIDHFHGHVCVEAIRRCLELDRRAVAALAAEQFDTARIVARVLGALQAAAGW